MRLRQSFSLRAVAADSAEQTSDLFRRQYVVDFAAVNGVQRHVVSGSAVGRLGDGDASGSFDVFERGDAVGVKSRHNDGNGTDGPLVGKRFKKYRDYIGPAARLSYIIEFELIATNSYIASGRYHEDRVRFDSHCIANFHDSHFGMGGQNLGKETQFRTTNVIDDHKSATGITWQAIKEPAKGFLPSGRAANAHDGERVFRSKGRVRVHRCSDLRCDVYVLFTRFLSLD